MRPNEPFVLGLTGGIACGKTTVARYLHDLGLPVLDADAISRSLTAKDGEALPAVRKAFGDDVFNGDQLDRRALGRIVFSDEEKRRNLEEILHPMVIGRMKRETDALETPIVVWDVPLLYEAGMDAQCGEVWCCYVSEAEQVSRVMRRDSLSREEAQARVNSQMPMTEKRQRATHTIHTAGSLADTRRRVRGLLGELRRRNGLE